MVDYSKALSKSGLDTIESGKLIYNLSGASNLKALLNKLDSNPKISDAAKDEIIVSLGRKYKTDQTIIDKLEADLKNNPSLSAKLEQNIINNPTGFMKALLPAYTGGNLAQAITAAIPPVVAAQPTTPKAPAITTIEPAPTTSKPVEKQPKPAVAKTKPVITAAPVGAPTAPSSAEPKEPTAQPATPAVAQQLGSSSSTASASADSDTNDALFKNVFEKFADASDKDIAKRVDSDFVKALATGLSKDAITKFGVSSSTADGFANRIKTDPKLAQAITTNLQNNPEFVRQLAKMAKDKAPLSEPVKSMAQSEMNRLMANPQFLADEKYVQGLQQKIEMAEQFKKDGIAGFFKSFFGPLGSGFSHIGSIVAMFRGKNEVFSMRNGTLYVNKGAMAENAAAAYAWGTTSTRDMTVLALNGERFKDVPVKDDKGQPVMKDGKPVTERVPNTVEVTTADGKKVKIIPATGVLLAQQEKGRFDPDTKQFIPGNIHVPVVTALAEDGTASSISKIVMTPAEFAKYQKLANDTSAKHGDGRQLAFNPYTEEDARKAGIIPQMQIARVDPKTGVVTEGTGVQGSGRQPTKNGTVPSPERDLELLQG